MILKHGGYIAEVGYESGDALEFSGNLLHLIPVD